MRRRWGQSYTSPICALGESVYFKISASRHTKLKSSWYRGVWLGKHSVTNDHRVDSATGEVLRVRTIRRHPGTSQWQFVPLLEVKGTPDSPSCSGDLDIKFILGEESLSFKHFKGVAEPLGDGQAPATSSGGVSSEKWTMYQTK